MRKLNSKSEDSFTSNSFIKKAQHKKNQVISTTLAKRNYLLRELKETDAMLHNLMHQLNLDEEYKKLNRIL